MNYHQRSINSIFALIFTRSTTAASSPIINPTIGLPVFRPQRQLRLLSSLSSTSSSVIAFANPIKEDTSGTMSKTRRSSPRTKASAAGSSTSAASKKAYASKTKPAAASKRGLSKKHYTRPGVEAAARLVSLEPPLSNHILKWERASSHYTAMIKAKGGSKLVKLDKQREGIAKTWTASNDEQCMTKDQLLDTMIEWKFTKGKPRNALKPMLKSNTESSIVTASKLAFEVADSIPKDGIDNDAESTTGKYNTSISRALNHLCELKGVGPATASAILCLYRPDVYAFMDDEVIECLYNGKRGYTMKIYLEVNKRCAEIATELNNEKEAAEEEWTPCKVGKALWTLATMSATGDKDGLLSTIFDDDEEDNNVESSCGSNEENEGSSNKRAKKN